MVSGPLGLGVSTEVYL